MSTSDFNHCNFSHFSSLYCTFWPPALGPNRPPRLSPPATARRERAGGGQAPGGRKLPQPHQNMTCEPLKKFYRDFS